MGNAAALSQSEASPQIRSGAEIWCRHFDSKTLYSMAAWKFVLNCRQKCAKTHIVIALVNNCVANSWNKVQKYDYILILG